ncbi:MAG: tetratricopeptide repeat protein [Acidobacteriaceae bacterium]
MRQVQGRALSLLLPLLACTLLGQQQNPLSAARHELDSGHSAEAIATLETYRRDHPHDPDVSNLLGIAYDRAGDADKSLQMFQEFARLAPNRPEAFNNLGAAYLRADNAEQAETAFRRSLALRPGAVDALYNLGALLNARGKYSESKPLLEQAYRQDRSGPVAYELAVAMAETGDKKEALKILESSAPPKGVNAAPWLKLAGTLELAQGKTEAASRALDSAVQLQPDDLELPYDLALVRLQQGRADAAIPLLDKSFAQLPASSRDVREGAILASKGFPQQALSRFEQAAIEDPGSYDALYNVAVLRLERSGPKDLDLSLDAAQRAMNVHNTGEIHDLLADIDERRKDYKNAVLEYQEATRLDPDSDRFAFDLGAELLLHENYQAAETILRAAQARNPRSSQIYLALGAAEFMAGKTADSVEAFLKAIDLNPSFEPAYLFLGEAYTFSNTRSEEVLAKLAHLAAKQPQSFGAQYYYGTCLVVAMNNDGVLTNASLAMAALNRAAQLRPRDARVYYQLGEVLRLEKRPANAVSYYTKAIALDPDYPEPLYKLGQAYAHLGKQEDAEKMFDRHRAVMSKQEESLDRRSSEIQSFIVSMKGVDESRSNPEATRHN